MIGLQISYTSIQLLSVRQSKERLAVIDTTVRLNSHYRVSFQCAAFAIKLYSSRLINFALIFLQKITKETERTHLKKNKPFPITGSSAIVCN